MKRLSLSFIFAVILLLSSYSQLIVADDNNVGIGESSPDCMLSINGAGNTWSTLYVENSTTTSIQRPAHFKKTASGDNGSDYSYGVLTDIIHNGGKKLIGGMFRAHTTGTPTNYKTIGLYGKAGNGADGYNYGVYGYLYGSRNGAAIFGSISGSEYDTEGKYAGYFMGEVKITSNLYVTGSYNPSDVNLKKDIRPLSTEESKQVVKLKSITAIKFKYKTPVELNSIPPEVADTMKVDPRTIEYTEDKYTKDQIGFSAQEVQQVYPELVKEGQDGYLNVNYVGLIPVLVEAIKEHDEVIETQDETIQYLEGVVQAHSEDIKYLMEELEKLRNSETKK